MRWLWLAIPISLYLLWTWPVSYAPGVQVADEPRQTLVGGQPAWELKGFHIQPLASYEIRARVLGRAHYWFDNGSTISPVDLAVGWGRMSDQAVLDRISWSQGYRFLRFSAVQGNEWPISFDVLTAHSANMHLVPATARILNDIRLTRDGSIVRLSGYLIEATTEHAQPWRSSLSRTDTGSGACELMWVTEFQRE